MSTVAITVGGDHRRVAIVLGTRPESIKLAGVIKLLGPGAVVVHTSQHHHRSLSGEVHRTLGLRDAQWEHLGIVDDRRGAQLGRAVAALDRVFTTTRPWSVIVQGDTTSAVAGALAANANDLPLVHVEAGLRSFDRRMPEEHNRVVIDHLADLCCAPTPLNRQNLVREGIDPARIAVTGNTVVEAVLSMLPPRPERHDLVRARGVVPGDYVLATLHRPENVDDPTALRGVLTALGSLPAPVVLPLHPRTAARVEQHGLTPLLGPLRVTNPLEYREMLAMAKECALLLTDSGGLQEEATVLRCPFVVVRRSTERPESEGTFGVRVPTAAELAPVARRWLADAKRRRAELRSLPSPFGDGTASRRVVDLLDSLLAARAAPGHSWSASTAPMT
ncbi:non-hydrolyzing UDP-N-acetylglucosamine 2-epimerase [Actinokineospora guangxiensis]|uniref:Non-hydrolyzing UDP-N-acetylglucosamine 2-epimerase n=1 Tax=Actinokineospora guangxiensis TaxID=1490288 RepID=A0ABW0EK10_9PSEU